MEYLGRSWGITFYALFEDWRFREHLLAFIQEVRLLKLEVSSIFSARMRTRLYPELEKQNALTTRLLAELPDPEKANMEDLRSYLVKELYRMNKEKEAAIAGEHSPTMMPMVYREYCKNWKV